MERDKAMDKEKEKLYIVCNSAKEIAPRHILRIYKRKSDAYKFLGKHVSELNNSTYTGYLSIAEKVVGDNDDLTILGEKRWNITTF